MKGLILSLLLSLRLQAQPGTDMHHYSYLALGDSYTIGEAVPLQQSFPYQLTQLLRVRGFSVHAPEIIAKTGWTTDELSGAMKSYRFLPKYDFVTLLIGVNNQYRGREVIAFKQELEALIQRAIELAGGKKEHVVLMSIPNYGLTPFAASLDREKIGSELSVFNSVIKALTIQYKVQFADITPDFDEAAKDAELVAADGLHPSGKAYERWAQRVAAAFAALL